MKVKTETILKLNQEEVETLRKLLGNLSDNQKGVAGLNVEQKQITSEIWSALPSFDDEC